HPRAARDLEPGRLVLDGAGARGQGPDIDAAPCRPRRRPSDTNHSPRSEARSTMTRVSAKPASKPRRRRAQASIALGRAVAGPRMACTACRSTLLRLLLHSRALDLRPF